MRADDIRPYDIDRTCGGECRGDYQSPARQGVRICRKTDAQRQNAARRAHTVRPYERTGVRRRTGRCGRMISAPTRGRKRAKKERPRGAKMFGVERRRAAICGRQRVTHCQRGHPRKSEMTLDYCFFCHDKKHFCVVKGHFCSFLVSNIID